MKDLKKFIKSSGVYLLGNVLTKAISFLLLPMYTKYLSPADYGTYDLNIAYITFLSSILFLDIWAGIMRYMFDYKTENEKSQPIVAGMIIFSISTFVYTIFVFVFGKSMSIPFLWLLFLYGLITNLNQVVGFVARAKGKNYIYSIGGLVGSAVSIIFNIIFIAVLKLSYEYLYVAYIIGTFINMILVGTSIHFVDELNKKYFNKKLIIEMLVYAAPLSINSAAYWFLSNYNKVVISNELSSVDNGLYAVSNKFSNIIQLFTQCFQMAWQELTFSKAGSTREEMNEFYTVAVNEYIKFLSLGTIVLIPIIKIIFPIMIDSSYDKAINIVPFSLIATLFSCISSFLGSIINTLKINKYIFTTTVFGTIVNIVLINILIKPIGLQAASISLACGYLIIVVRRVMLLNNYVKIKIDYLLILYISIMGGISGLCYVYGSNFLNGIVFWTICFLSALIYRDKIHLLINRISRKKSSDNKH